MPSQTLGLIVFPFEELNRARETFPEADPADFGGAGVWGWLRFDLFEGPVDAAVEDRAREFARSVEETVLILRSDLARWWTFAVLPRKGAPVRAWIHHGGPSVVTKSDAKVPTATLLERLEFAGPNSYKTPPELLEKLGDAKGASGIKALRKLQAARIVEAVKSLDLCFDHKVLRPLIADATGKLAVEEIVDEFLEIIGAGKARVRLEDDPDWNVGGLRESAGTSDRSESLYKLAPKARPIAGGPVALSASDLELFWHIPWFCQTDTEVDLLIHPSDGRLFIPPSYEHWRPYHLRDGRTYIEVPWAPPGHRHRFFRQVGEALAKLPGGTTVEMVSSVTDDGAPHQAGRQRYLGVLDGKGHFLVTHASIPLRPADLLEALELTRKMIEPSPSFELPTEADARAVREAAGKTGWFFEKADWPKVDGRTVTPASPDNTLFTSLMVFRQRFLNGPWNTREDQAQDEQSQAEWGETIEKVSDSLVNLFAAPSDGPVLFRGEVATFRESEWDRLYDRIQERLEGIAGPIDGEDPCRVSPSEILAPVDATLVELGFEPLGNVHCDRFADLYLRGYALSALNTFACVVAGTVGQFHYEFVTRFERGGGLTTSTIPNTGTYYVRNAYHRAHPQQSPAELWKSHQKHLRELTGKGNQPLAIEPSLVGFCRAIEAYLAQ